jgi:Domain of unknown function (DUF6429)
MEIDHDRIDEAVLALLWLTLHDGCRAWKGLIAGPVNKTKSVVLTDEGLQKAEELFKALFTRKP